MSSYSITWNIMVNNYLNPKSNMKYQASISDNRSTATIVKISISSTKPVTFSPTLGLGRTTCPRCGNTILRDCLYSVGLHRST